MEQDRPPRRTRPQFTGEFKADAVALVDGWGFDGRLGGARSEIGEMNLGNWVRRDRIDRWDKPGLTTAGRAELARLRRSRVSRPGLCPIRCLVPRRSAPAIASPRVSGDQRHQAPRTSFDCRASPRLPHYAFATEPSYSSGGLGWRWFIHADEFWVLVGWVRLVFTKELTVFAILVAFAEFDVPVVLVVPFAVFVSP